MYWNIIIMSLSLLALAGCGHTATDRGVSGAGIGAATGAAVGAVTGMTVAQGALIGAAGGAIVGLATDSDQVNLGKPAWKRGDSGSRADSYAANSGTDRATVRAIQSGLNRHGFDAGRVDGVVGPRTRQAIRDYQAAYGLLVDGQPSRQLADHIIGH
jgi:peptidoglycan hydrolase-like protein with peptidoglycan-binding domain